MRILKVLIAVYAGAVAAQQGFPDYFPLQAGNQWVYRSVDNTIFHSMSVSGEKDFNGLTYVAVLQNGDPASAVYYRNDGAGKIYFYDPLKQLETLAYDFTQGPGNPTFDGKPYTVTKAGAYSGPLGDFTTAFEIARINTLLSSSETFLPYVGKVASSSKLQGGSASLVPALVENLVYARLNEITVLTTKDWGFGITLDRPVYQLQFGKTDDCQSTNFPGQVATAANYHPCAQVRLTLRIAGNAPVRLTVPTQQIYELELRDSAQNLVWRLSDQRQFIAGPRELVVGPGEVNFVELVPLYTSNATPVLLLAPGSYRLTATLLDASSSASAAIAFTVLRP